MDRNLFVCRYLSVESFAGKIRSTFNPKGKIYLQVTINRTAVSVPFTLRHKRIFLSPRSIFCSYCDPLLRILSAAWQKSKKLSGKILMKSSTRLNSKVDLLKVSKAKEEVWVSSG